MKRVGALPERTWIGPYVDRWKAGEWVGRRFRINDTCWACGLVKNKRRWVETETQVESGATGTVEFSEFPDGGAYSMRWDDSKEMRSGYTLMNQRQLTDLIRRGVLVEIERAEGELIGKRIRVKEGTRKSRLSDKDALFDCDGMCPTKGRKRPVLSLMDIEAGAEGTILALITVPHRGKIYEVIWDDGEQEGFTYTKARGAYPLAQILAGAVIL